MSQADSSTPLSVIIPVCERTENTLATFKEYQEYLGAKFTQPEYIFVVSKGNHHIGDQLVDHAKDAKNITVMYMSRDFGEATAIQAGMSKATGELILILPTYKQVETSSLGKLFEHIEEYDLVLAKRWPRIDTAGNQIQTKTFNYLLRKFSGQNFTDIGCGVRLLKSVAAKELNLYGDQHRFLPLLVHQIGYSFTEIELPQAKDDAGTRLYTPQVYLRRLLDLLTVVFLTKFNKKPLRFFGLLGSGSIGIGALGLLYLALERFAWGIPLSDRPLLVMFCLFFVLGFQLLAIGLIGEIIIFTHAGDQKEYRIKKIHDQDSPD
ncbi:glycosyltransferase [Ketobacter sp. MCCC 1A13808]|uniref:glycosyltransferase n=1 Tax=Ketobacter sp. MCCC 1A13808 TaxID=2602738 RepID=UPI000F247107|nr:glycosyltransferase [Ketobacter sp. MCCC 1A13808]MVF11651.1 glycosyltransferase [Ketobacter sp. MCCC 1A13808]RLP55267.1 MAG: glycosyltransferase [Ketobacter sp.]